MQLGLEVPSSCAPRDWVAVEGVVSFGEVTAQSSFLHVGSPPPTLLCINPSGMGMASSYSSQGRMKGIFLFLWEGSLRRMMR